MRRQRAGRGGSSAIRRAGVETGGVRRWHHRLASPPDAGGNGHPRPRLAVEPMSPPAPPLRRVLMLGARLILGAVFVYLGLTKALDPVGFLKLLRQFDLLPGHLMLNLVAAVLPWCEVLCGLLLLLGWRV